MAAADPMSRMTVEQALSLAAAHRSQGRLAPAEAICRQVLAHYPGQAQAMFLLATVMAETGRLPQAIPLLRDLVERRPDEEAAWLLLASALRRTGLFDEAAAVLRRALERFPASVAACQELGLIERGRGNLPGAIDWLQRALQRRPDFIEARNNLGLTLTEAGQSGAAIEQFQAALRAQPAIAELHYNLGIALAALGRHAESAAAYERATAIRPEYVEAWVNLGVSLKLMGQLDRAIAALERALRLQPGRAATHSHLAGIYEWQARHDEALATHRRAMDLAPEDAQIHGSYLYTLIFCPGYDARALREAHEQWDRRHGRPVQRLSAPAGLNRSPERRLRVGYVCGSFRDHVLGRYLMPLLREHDRSAVEVICYSNNRSDDEATESFRRIADGWRDIVRLTDDSAAARVRADGIDILVDTTLHMEGSRLLLFARKPAPLQVTMAGYPGSTGLAAIDYRLTDDYLDPPGTDDSVYVEQSVRLPDTFWCYDPLGENVAAGPLPADGDGSVTFGCLNNFSKVNDGVIALWAAVLRAVEGSRLRLLCHEGSHRSHTVRKLARHGVEPRRVDFVGYRPRPDYLKLFQGIDISLDTVPYNGHTTSLDSLWMGVPVVTLVGTTVVGRAGLSQLTNIGLPELIAYSPEQFVAIATALAADRPRLRELRHHLRGRMESSPLMDAKRFARNVEAAYRQMWRHSCSAPG
jgi:predicted O-linked N-acetylglucosamine transferase (SPINDLY family)